MNKKILVQTVGGSHEPILTSIKENKPDFICFFCSGKDLATGKPGSEKQITGEGSVIKKSPGDDSPSLPNIPTLAGLEKDQYEVVIIPADEPDAAFKKISERLHKLISQHPGAAFIADYTGGTKSMTAALVLAAVEHREVTLQLVTGNRVNLHGVESGMGTTGLIPMETVRVQRALTQFTEFWRYFSYGEAARGLVNIKPAKPGLKRKLRVLLDLSKAFGAWDRFDHQQAHNIIGNYGKLIAPAHQHLLNSLTNLTTKSDRQTLGLLWDLWFNALRRAEQGRYDDAVARLYRLLEWTAQWILQVNCGVDKTGDIPADKIPSSMSLQANPKGQYQAGLLKAWELVGHHHPDKNSAAFQFSKCKLKAMQTQLEKRNYSILAHGFSPISEEDWRAFRNWMKENFLPMLKMETQGAGLKTIPQQLPQRTWPEIEQMDNIADSFN